MSSQDSYVLCACELEQSLHARALSATHGARSAVFDAGEDSVRLVPLVRGAGRARRGVRERRLQPHRQKKVSRTPLSERQRALLFTQCIQGCFVL